MTPGMGQNGTKRGLTPGETADQEEVNSENGDDLFARVVSEDQRAQRQLKKQKNIEQSSFMPVRD